MYLNTACPPPPSSPNPSRSSSHGKEHKQVLAIIFILPSIGTSVYGQVDLPRLLVEPEQEHDDVVLLLLLPDSPVPNQPDHIIPGMSVQGKAVQIEPELDNPDPDEAVTVQVVAGGVMGKCSSMSFYVSSPLSSGWR